MTQIATLTVNPAIDKSTRVGQVVPEKKLRCQTPRREPGGGGINVSRVIRRLGGNSTAVYLAGGPTGEILRQLLDAEGLTQHPLEIAAWTRENLVVYEESTGQQYRFGMPGAEIRENEWQRCLETVSNLDPPPEYLVASGSLSPGMPDDFYAQIAKIAQKVEAKLVVDTSGAALRQAADVGAYLLKPNVGEFQELVGETLDTEQQQDDAARRLIDQGGCSAIVLSLGAGGARVISSQGSEHVRTPTVPIRSKVGAGDSMVAGIVLGLARGMEISDAVRFGVAAGAAAVMTEGTELCHRQDVERLYEEMKAW